MEENHQTISEFEIKLAQFNDLPNDVELLKDVSILVVELFDIAYVTDCRSQVSYSVRYLTNYLYWVLIPTNMFTHLLQCLSFGSLQLDLVGFCQLQAYRLVCQLLDLVDCDFLMVVVVFGLCHHYAVNKVFT